MVDFTSPRIIVALIGFVGIVIVALFNYRGRIKAALLSNESGENDNALPRSEISAETESTGESSASGDITQYSGNTFEGDVVGTKINNPPPSESDPTKENERDAEPYSEDYPSARYCSSTWADILVFDDETTYFENTDETTTYGIAENKTRSQYTAQVDIRYETDEGNSNHASTSVTLDPNDSADWQITVDGRARNPEADDSVWVRQCPSADPPWDEIPIDTTDYPECTGYTTTMGIEDDTPLSSSHMITVRIESMFSIEVTAEFQIEYTIDGVPQISDPFEICVPGSVEMSCRRTVDVPDGDYGIENISITTPSYEKDYCRLIYGEY